jgi:L-amino acid N-acyltransferase YncA
MLNIRPLAQDDWTAAGAVYQDGIATGNATFQTGVPSWEIWDANHLQSCRLAAEKDGCVVAWAALGPYSRLPVFSGVAEVSIYVAGRVRGQGVGARLLSELVAASEHAGLWTLLAGVFPENTASLALHRRAGFREIGRRERVGCLHGVWRDVVLFERRSRVNGCD